MPNTSFALLSGLLLAGGQGSRLGGRDKGLMQWRGEVVSARLASLLRPRVGQLLISCNRNQASYAQWADQLVGDPLPDYPGPMAGMLAGLRACRGSHLLVLPCDLPALDGALLDALLETVSVRDAARVAAKVTGLPRDTLYTLALQRQRAAEGPEAEG